MYLQYVNQFINFLEENAITYPIYRYQYVEFKPGSRVPGNMIGLDVSHKKWFYPKRRSCDITAAILDETVPRLKNRKCKTVKYQSWENHCEKHGNTQISRNLTHKLWKMLAPGRPGRSYQTKPGLPSRGEVNIKCFYAKSTCLCSNYRNSSSLTLVQKVIPGYLQRTVDN
jgi:hypothetical protein